MAPTFGSAHSLTLTTFVTSAADLHYVVVASGQPPLDAAAIKNAAMVCATPVENAPKPEAVPQPHDPMDRHRHRQRAPEPEAEAASGVVTASTVVVPSAQKIERQIHGLIGNTSYDVYFVAEVRGSNGVFGPVLSVLQSKTHPEPPTIDMHSIQAVNDSATAVYVNATLSSPGNVYFALIPSLQRARSNLHLQAAEILANRTYEGLHAVFAVAKQQHEWHELSILKALHALTPSTEYDMLIVMESLGSGGVVSEVVQVQEAFRTHAVPPSIQQVNCFAQNASASGLHVEFELAFDPQDLLRVTSNSLPFFSYNLHYEAKLISSTKVKSEHSASEQRQSEAKDEGSSSVCGQILLGNASSPEELLLLNQQIQSMSITGLQSGAIYQVVLYAETASSSGLLGDRFVVISQKTHDLAPLITAGSANPTNASVHSLTAIVELDHSGDVHFIAAKKANSGALRMYFQQAKNASHLATMIHERDGAETVSGVVRFDPAPAEDTADATTCTRDFVIHGLADNSAYNVVLFSETSGSNGVFGSPFGQLVEASTNENASDVSLNAAEPVFGNTTSVEISIYMSKPSDILYYCLRSEDRPQSPERCLEVEKGRLVPLRNYGQNNDFTFVVGNLTQDTVFSARVYAENAHRNSVFSARTKRAQVKTHRDAPIISHAVAHAVASTTEQISASISVEKACLVHYLVTNTKVLDEVIPDVKAIVQSTGPSFPGSVATGHLYAGEMNRTNKFQVNELKANTTYTIFIVTESSVDGRSSGVYGEITTVNITTHAMAPKIVKAWISPASGKTDTVVITANISTPGRVHYLLSDIDFADPALIKQQQEPGSAPLVPHVVRGEFDILAEDIVMEIINGTNDTKPMEPLVYARNLTVTDLKSSTTYHGSLTTETLNSDGVFGEFPPPILVATHMSPPTIVPSTFVVKATPGSSSSISIELELNRLGEVHCAAFFRGLVADRSDAVFQQRKMEQDQEKARLKANELPDEPSSSNSSNATEIEHVWPPLSSDYDLSNLNGSLLKAARFEDLGAGVWENMTISVSREDVLKGKLTTKELTKLPPNGVFDVCLVSETASSDGIFAWTDADHDCHRVTTHADYTNQSLLYDEITIQPIDGETSAVQIQLTMSKLLNVAMDTAISPSGEVLNPVDRLTAAAGRIPYFVLVDAKDGRREFMHNAFARASHTQGLSVIKRAVVGRDHVVAAGMLTNVSSENETFLVLQLEICQLKPNREYYLFFAYETSGSNGVFTQINPHKHRSNDSKHESDGIAVKTHDIAPRLNRYEVSPTYGNTTRITITVDIACSSCKEALVHALVYPAHCVSPSVDILRPNASIPSQETSHLKADCDGPLVRRHFNVSMGDRESFKTNVDHDIAEELQPNTTYKLLLATETVNASGVFSDAFAETLVTTYPPAPGFKSLSITPRKGSTTELLLQFELERAGEVHFMCGEAGKEGLNVTSPYNISAKKLPGPHSPNFHDYPREVVRMRRSIKIERAGEKHVEVLDYLAQGTGYDLFVVAESSESNGVYGEIRDFSNVATFSNAPLLLAHSAYPTPATTTSITVGFRVNTPGVVHFSIVSASLWYLTEHAATGSGNYGNRLAMEEQLVRQASLEITEQSMQKSTGDSGWREVQMEVPHSGTNYTVYLVTETTDSEGVYGSVASHEGVASHSVAPMMLYHRIAAADARVDALKVDMGLSASGHIHYAVVAHRDRFDPDSLHNVIVYDSVTANASSEEANNATISTTNGSMVIASFVIPSLKEGTMHDVYFRAETLGSYGVFGAWTAHPVAARTHGLPPDVLEDLECNVSPSCEALGRETVGYKV